MCPKSRKSQTRARPRRSEEVMGQSSGTPWRAPRWGVAVGTCGISGSGEEGNRMRRLANEPELSEKQLEEFEQKLESCLADLHVKAGQVTREGREPMDWSAVDVADRAVSGITKE